MTDTPAYRLILPPGWVRLPTVAAESRRDIRKLVDARFATLPRDTFAALRREVETTLVQTVRNAAANGANDLLLLVNDVAGIPVSASCVIYRASPPGADVALSARQLAANLGDRADVTVVPLAGGQAVRQRRLTTPRIQDGHADSSTVLTYFVPIPDTFDYLVLAFSTSTLPLADALCGLFDAMAATIQFS